jgi:hypothetical protein
MVKRLNDPGPLAVVNQPIFFMGSSGIDTVVPDRVREATMVLLDIDIICIDTFRPAGFFGECP